MSKASEECTPDAASTMMSIPYPLREMTNREIGAMLVSQCKLEVMLTQSLCMGLCSVCKMRNGFNIRAG